MTSQSTRMAFTLACLALAVSLLPDLAFADDVVEARSLDADATGIGGFALGLLTTLRHLPVVMVGLVVGGLGNIAGDSARWKLPMIGAFVLGGLGWLLTVIYEKFPDLPELPEIPTQSGLMAVMLLSIMLFFRFAKPAGLVGTIVAFAVLPLALLWLPLFQQAIEPGRMMLGIMAGFAAVALAGQGFAGVLRQSLSESSLRATALGMVALASMLLMGGEITLPFVN